MKSLFLVALLSVVAMAQQTAVPSDQDPMHKTVLRNDYLIVLRVILKPGESTGFHTHSRDAIAVRLSEAETKMQEPGQPPGETRGNHPGDVTPNDYTAHPFTHKVINVGKDTDFVVLDIEALKHDGANTLPIGPVAAENPSMRAYRYELLPGQSTPQHSHARPYLVVAATPMDLRMTSPDGQSSTHPVKPGDMHWVDQKVTHTLTNNGSERGVIVEIEMK